ncbi:hypothetical protein ASA1KI_03560 [Opitutales bacterium ASA1]|uniref:type II secretion system protein GspG n=1 Tax=Congregicoccus parvus TaxID=3081749 RepID=UPI002B316C9D|nr:hypothetical protein ASA1KI_03560 [Opitutales bacterium ASA1]
MKIALLAASFVLLCGACGVWLLRDFHVFDDRELPAKVARMFIHGDAAVALDRFRSDVGRYPTTEEGLDSLIVCPSDLKGVWRGPYIGRDKFPDDPQGRSFQYRSPGRHCPEGYDLWSLGHDGIESADDIGNWMK